MAADPTFSDSEYGGRDGLYGNVDAGAPLSPWLEAVAYRQSARKGDVTGKTTYSPEHGTGGTRVN